MFAPTTTSTPLDVNKVGMPTWKQSSWLTWHVWWASASCAPGHLQVMRTYLKLFRQHRMWLLLKPVQMGLDLAKLNMDADGNVALLPGRTLRAGKVRSLPSRQAA